MSTALSIFFVALSGVTPVGLTHRSFAAPEVRHWRGQASQRLEVDVWYPAAASAVVSPLRFPPQAELFDAGAVGRDAPWSDSQKLPLLVASHGTGGASLQLGWLAARLAQKGYVVAAVNHPGNNAGAPYTAAGFVLWWERARDLSIVIDKILADPGLGPHVDVGRVGALGFSLGGYTVLELAGARTDRAAFSRYCEAKKDHALCDGPPEFPTLAKDVAAEAPKLAPSFAEAGAVYKDKRVRAVFALAPALGPALTPESLRAIDVPVMIVAGPKDVIAVPAVNGRAIAALIPGARFVSTPMAAGHYTFLAACTEAGRKNLAALCTDAPGVDRGAAHDFVADEAARFFGHALSSAGAAASAPSAPR